MTDDRISHGRGGSFWDGRAGHNNMFIGCQSGSAPPFRVGKRRGLAQAVISVVLFWFIWFCCYRTSSYWSVLLCLPSFIASFLEVLLPTSISKFQSHHLQSFVDSCSKETSVSICTRHSFAFFRFFFVFSMPHSLLRSFRSTR